MTSRNRHALVDLPKLSEGTIFGMPPIPVKILVDHGERRSGLPAEIRKLGLTLSIVQLAVGDVVVEGCAGVERKTIQDLHRSIATGRLWRQIGALRRGFEHRYLVVEGPFLHAGPVVPHGVRGALLAVAESGVIVLRAHGVSESARWIQSIVVRHRDTRQVPRRRQPRARSRYVLLRTVPGVTPIAARELLERFGSVKELAAASDDQLLEVRGVGPGTLAALRRALC